MTTLAAKWQPSGARTGGTVTDPLWADLIVAFLAVVALLTVAVILDAVFKSLQRRAQQRRAMRSWSRDVEQARWERTGLL